MECLFCKIAHHKIKSKILYEDDLIIAFLDIHPKTNGHTIIIPKNHFEDFTVIDKETLYHMKNVAKILTKKIMQLQKNKRMTLMMNYQSKKNCHVHLHLIPDLNSKKKVKPIEEIYKTLKNSEP